MGPEKHDEQVNNLTTIPRVSTTKIADLSNAKLQVLQKAPRHQALGVRLLHVAVRAEVRQDHAVGEATQGEA